MQEKKTYPVTTRASKPAPQGVTHNHKEYCTPGHEEGSQLGKTKESKPTPRGVTHKTTRSTAHTGVRRKHNSAKRRHLSQHHEA